MVVSGARSIPILTGAQLEQIHSATLEVLERTGLIMEHPRARELLDAAGCEVGDDDRVRFPPHVVEEAIRSAPAEVTIHMRDGRPRMTLGDRHVHYGTVTTLPFLAAPDGKRRPYTLRDCREMTIVMDCLDSLDFATGTGNCADVPPAVSDVHEIWCMIENSPKPVLVATHDELGLETLIDIVSVLKGSMKSSRREPFVLYCVCPISPLKYPMAVLAKMMRAVEVGFPFIVVPSPMAGGTSPVSLAGTLVCGNAEILSGLVLAQAVRPGAPFLYGGFLTIMDMASAVMTHGSPEFALLNAAQAELARRYRLPSFSSAGCTDAHEIDAQAAFECGISTFVAALCGANLVHAIGVIGSGTAVCKELLILNHDMIGYVSRFFRGIAPDEALLGVEEIASVGPGGSFLETELTLDRFKEEHWFPMCFVREQAEKWLRGDRARLRQRLTEEFTRILRRHVPPPLSDENRREIEKIIRSSDRARLNG